MEIELKQQIQKWLKADPDYISGLGLLIQVCKNKTLLRNLSRKQTPNNLKKIAWELKKSIGESSLGVKKIPTQKKKIALIGSQSALAGKKLAKIFKTYPETIQTIITLNGKLSSDRDILHRSLKKIPEANTEDNKTKRAEILIKIKVISDHLEHLFKIKDLFFTDKVIPTEEDLYLPEQKLPKTGKKAKQNPIDKMSEADLIKKRTNLRSNLTKKKNKLLYQSTSKKKEENPMPEGSKRDTLEEQIKEDRKALILIESKLDGFSKPK